MRSRLLSVTAAGLALTSLLLGAPSAAPASTTASVTVQLLPGDPALPHLIKVREPRVVTGELVVSGGPVSNVRVELSGAGLIVEPAVIEVAGPTTGFDFAVHVSAGTGGFHSLEARVSSDSTGPTSTPGPLFYVPGGEPIAATGDLTGVGYGFTDPWTYEGGDGSGTTDTLLTFVDKHSAFLGAPPRGRPRCHDVDEDAYRGCVPYRFDASSGLVEIGGVVAKVVGTRLWISGIGAAEDDEYVNERFLGSHVRYVKPGARFAGRWHGGERGQPALGPWYDLMLRRDGTFRLRTSRYDPPTYDVDAATTAGTYRVTGAGKLVLRTRTGHRSLHTFLVRTTSRGLPEPARGVWLVFRTREADGTFVYNEIRFRRAT